MEAVSARKLFLLAPLPVSLFSSNSRLDSAHLSSPVLLRSVTATAMASSLALRRLTSLSLSTAPRFSTRFLSSSTRRAFDDGRGEYGSTPAPPRLPKEEQEMFEHLQKHSTGAFSTSRLESDSDAPEVKRNAQGEELHPDTVVGPKPEFEGDTNPKTGEVGGPKNDPLRWGAQGDWSYSGRVTDF